MQRTHVLVYFEFPATLVKWLLKFQGLYVPTYLKITTTVVLEGKSFCISTKMGSLNSVADAEEMFQRKPQPVLVLLLLLNKKK